MMQKIRKGKERNFDAPTISVDKVADANTNFCHNYHIDYRYGFGIITYFGMFFV
mgnify:CR=1 FL=1